MPDPDRQQSSQVSCVWQDNSAPTGKGRQYKTVDGRTFEGGVAPAATTHNIIRNGMVVDQVRG